MKISLILVTVSLLGLEVNDVAASTRIVGGSFVQEGKYPWMVHIILYSNLRFYPHCGGSLISNQHVLTAAHCKRSNVFVSIANNGKYLIPIRRFVNHPQYMTLNTSLLNDIAIIFLKRAVPLSDTIKPINLYQGETIDEESVNWAKVVGWGSIFPIGPSSPNLQEINVPIISNYECEQLYKRRFVIILESMICSGYQYFGGEDHCNGDSGGPLFITNGNVSTQIGIVSAGVACGNLGYPGVYTRVGPYLGWIKSHIHQFNPPQNNTATVRTRADSWNNTAETTESSIEE